MGKKKRDETGSGSGSSEPIHEASKRARKEKSDFVTDVPKKSNSVSEKAKSDLTQTSSEVVKKLEDKHVNKNIKNSQAYTDLSVSSDSESEKNSSKNDKKSVSDSNSDSELDSSDSDSSPTSKEDVDHKVDKVKNTVNLKNSATKFVENYVPPRSSSSDSYHSDTEEEDKKQRKKQKKILQMQLNKRPKKSNVKFPEIKHEAHSDFDEDGGENMASNNVEVPEWPENDYAELIRRMEAQVPPKDNQKYDSRAAKLDWSKIAFSNHTPEECMEVWLAISKRIRRFRTLPEILHDAKEWVSKPWTNFYKGKKNRHPDMPAKPLSTYMIYFLEHKDKVVKENPGIELTQVSKIISEMYKNLSAEERDKYAEQSLKQRQNFDVKLTEFYKEHPELAQQQRKTQPKEVSVKGPRKASNPFKLFLQEQLKNREGDSRVDRKTIEEEAKEKWKKLSDKKKLIWINVALEDHKRYEDEIKVYSRDHPDYVPPNTVKSVLNKDERNIKERLAGKPVKPPNSAYSLFSRVMLQSDPDVKSIPPKQRMAEISKKWKEISDIQKAHYEEKVRAMQEAYKLEFASYLEGLSPEERESELKKAQPKRKPPKTDEKGKKKEQKNSNIESKTTNKNQTASLNLFKGEPEPPPVRVFDVFLQEFFSEHPQGGTEADRLNEARKHWNSLSESKKELYRKKHEEIKQKYIEDFEAFLKKLSPSQLKEFSVMKDLAKKNKEAQEQRELINGAVDDSNEESDDDDASSSGDSDSDGSDSGKSSKSSSSSDDSDS